MELHSTALEGVLIIDVPVFPDERGWFSRNFCTEEFEQKGFDFSITQQNYAFNRRKGTVRGMHYQSHPYEQTKIVSCVKGAMYDVVIDIRPDSPTFRCWFAKQLDESDQTAILIPGCFAHGYQTTEDDTLVSYLMDGAYEPNAARGFNWRDKAFGINWPTTEGVTISNRDANYPFM